MFHLNQISKRFCRDSILVGLFLCLSAWMFLDYVEFLKWISRGEWPVEYNSFYYLVELRNYIETGSGYYSSFLPFFFVLSSISKFFGLNGIEAHNLVVVASYLVFVLAIAALGFDKKRPYVAPALLFVALSSKSLFFAHYAFLKQATGLAAFACLLSFLRALKLCHNRWTRLALMTAALIAFGFAVSMHKFSAGLVILFFLTPLESRMSQKIRLASMATVVCIFLAIFVQQLPSIEDIFSIHWPPALKMYFDKGQISPTEIAEYLTYFLVASLVLFELIKEKIQINRLWLSVLIYFVLSALCFSPEAWRAHLSATWLFLIGLSLFQSSSETSENQLRAKNRILFLLVFVTLGNLLFLSKEPHMVGPEMPVEEIDLNQEVLRRWLPSDAFVIAPHGIEFRMTYFLRVRSARIPPKNYDATKIFSIKPDLENDPSCVAATYAGDFSEINCIHLGSYWKISRGL